MVSKEKNAKREVESEDRTKEANSQIDELREKLKECLKKKEEYLRGWQRERADFLNFKDRESRIVEEEKRKIKEEILKDLIEVLDSFELAFESLKGREEDEFQKGLTLIYSQLKDRLEKFGLEEISVKIGDKFDPNFCEAVLSQKGEEDGVILEIIEKGYSLEGKVIRPVKVKVSVK